MTLLPRISQAALLGAVLALALVLISACALPNESMTVKRFDPGSYPTLLSDWQLLQHKNGALTRAADTQIYSINTPLFADYTLKLRTISVPAGTQASYSDYEVLNFPVGTVISKTFYYDKRDVPLSEAASARPALFTGDNLQSLNTKTTHLLETRLLVNTIEGWQALPYVWNDAQTDAVLSLTGAIKDIGDNIYVVPSKDECASCHALGQDKVLHPIGPKARHLHFVRSDKPSDIAETSSLDALIERGWLTVPVSTASIKTNARWAASTDQAELQALDKEELNHRARSYLDANCGHCHNPRGSADTSHLYLDYTNHSNRTLGECKPPVAAGRGTGGNLYSIVPGDPTHSIISYRMRSTDPGKMMPEAGRTRVHAEGVALIEEWIRRQKGQCI